MGTDELKVNVPLKKDSPFKRVFIHCDQDVGQSASKTSMNNAYRVIRISNRDDWDTPPVAYGLCSHGKGCHGVLITMFRCTRSGKLAST